MARNGAIEALRADVALAVAWAHGEAVGALGADVALGAAWAHGEAIGALGADVALGAAWAGTVGDPPQRSAWSLCWMEDYFGIGFMCHCMRVHAVQVLPLVGRR
jgi:hypothetical protein